MVGALTVKNMAGLSPLIIISSRVTVEVKFAAYSYFVAHLYNLHS